MGQSHRDAAAGSHLWGLEEGRGGIRITAAGCNYQQIVRHRHRFRLATTCNYNRIASHRDGLPLDDRCALHAVDDRWRKSPVSFLRHCQPAKVARGPLHKLRRCDKRNLDDAFADGAL